MSSDRQKILLAVDGSPQSMEVVRYVSGICVPDATEITLFHVLSPLPESCWDFGEAPECPSAPSSAKMVARRRKVIEGFMEEARRMLEAADFASETVHCLVEHRREGVARDILREARRGYQAVVAGKAGRNPITRVVMGGVASKLVTALKDTNLWLVEGRPDTRRVLVCIDTSIAAGGLVEHVGRMLSAGRTHITLFHAIRNPVPDEDSGAGYSASPEAAAWEQCAREAMVPVFARAVASLEETGVASDRISVKVMSGVATRGGTLFAQALQGAYGTIVAGRRGLSRVKDFTIGRVPMKLVQLMKDISVWIVS